MATQLTITLNDETERKFLELISNTENAAKAQDKLQGGLKQTAQQSLEAEKQSRSLAASIGNVAVQTTEAAIAMAKWTPAIIQAHKWIGFTEGEIRLLGRAVNYFSLDLKEAGDRAIRANAIMEALSGRTLPVAASQFGLLEKSSKSFFSQLAGIGPQISGFTAGLKGLNEILERSGKTFVAVRDEAGQYQQGAKELAAELNRTGDSAEQFADRTGKSIEEMGLKIETNFDRAQQAESEFFSHVFKDPAVKAWKDFWSTNIFQPYIDNFNRFRAEHGLTWEAIDKSVTWRTDNYIKNLKHVGDGVDWLRRKIAQGLGVVTGSPVDEDSLKGTQRGEDEARKAARRAAEEAAMEERRKPQRGAEADFEARLKQQAEQRKESESIQSVTTIKEIDKRLAAEREARKQAVYEAKYEGDVKEGIERRLELLIGQRIKLERDAAAARKKAIDDQATWEKKHAEFLDRQQNEQFDRYIQQQRDKVKELKRQEAEEEAAARQSAYWADYARRAEEKAIAAARKAFEDSLNAKLKAQQEYTAKLQSKLEQSQDGGQSMIDKIKGTVSPQQVRAEIVRKRQEQAADEFRQSDKGQALLDRSAQGDTRAFSQYEAARKAAERKAGQQAFRDFNQGKIGSGDITATQNELAARTVQNMQRQGQISTSMGQAVGQSLASQAKLAQEQQQLQQQIDNLGRQFSVFNNQLQQGSQRRRAQNAGVRK